MNIIFLLYGFIILLIFNSLTHQFCLKMEMETLKQGKMFRVINIMVTVLLVCSYVRVMNVMV
ncbi:MAG: hypothetical protein ACQEWU_09420 [Bacillota bacterium]|uniref:Uncharacterized protein n=1 Tax=Virgibacillus salarius TaxID=447199 RepID=A0A941IC38_9BACI|nr:MULTISPECIES: hypothetical protein [Bacillaceae]NAZ09780.1 hypothetical protein [Agaribacter marinus]MBR7797071.1 hypothetical protein [Virgibacillus salarius]MCC2251930.1 hypothetical protein [Virgibacillus sp. AGTR]MDY7044922.1 hypothetical protein [Virgibacillus sp. M23]QRZ16458.1 hypothetical protein JUJ52_11550 [Virgibacillus sp. AGTR]